MFCKLGSIPSSSSLIRIAPLSSTLSCGLTAGLSGLATGISSSLSIIIMSAGRGKVGRLRATADQYQFSYIRERDKPDRFLSLDAEGPSSSEFISITSCAIFLGLCSSDADQVVIRKCNTAEEDQTYSILMHNLVIY